MNRPPTVVVDASFCVIDLGNGQRIYTNPEYAPRVREIFERRESDGCAAFLALCVGAISGAVMALALVLLVGGFV